MSNVICFWAFKLRLKFSLVDCEWGDWKIGECSVECGTGIRLNTREPKVLAAYDGEECSGLANATEICNIQECPGLFQVSWPNWITLVFAHSFSNLVRNPLQFKSIVNGTTGRLVIAPKNVVLEPKQISGSRKSMLLMEEKNVQDRIE